MRTWIASLAVVGLGAVLAACGDARSVSKGNFKEALNKDFETNNPLCYIVTTAQFPLPIRADGLYNQGSKKPQLDALVSAGVLSSKAIQMRAQYSGLAENKQLLKATEYSITDKGQKAYKQGLPASTEWPSGGSGFCFGTAKVESILDYETPKDVDGDLQTVVKYEVKVDVAEPWASEPSLATEFKDYALALKGESKGQALLVLGVKNWAVKHPKTAAPAATPAP